MAVQRNGTAFVVNVVDPVFNEARMNRDDMMAEEYKRYEKDVLKELGSQEDLTLLENEHVKIYASTRKLDKYQDCDDVMELDGLYIYSYADDDEEIALATDVDTTK